MDRKFLIILFATVFYNGVAQSSPVGQQISDVRLSEEKPPTVQPPTVEHINKKIETVPGSTAKPAAPVFHNATPVPPHVEVPTVKQATNHSNPEIPHLVDGKNSTHDSVNKSTTPVIDKKTANATTNNGNNATAATDNKNTTQPADSKNSTLPAPGKNTTEASTPAGQSTTVSSTTVVTTKAPPTTNSSSTTTVKPPATTVSTLPQSTTSKDSTITGQNTPAPPAQEKHFDGASFVGGIVLTIGLTAIGFIAFKYYKSGKIDMSYRTL